MGKDKTRILLGIIGSIIFLSGLGLGLIFLGGERRALGLDEENIRYGSISEGPMFCNWEVDVAERVISENKSTALIIEISNESTDECESTINLRAPAFDYSPAKEDQTITLPPQSKGSLSWIVTPERIGTYQIALADELKTKVIGVTVTNVLGLTTIQAKVASSVGGLFGPMLTVPWWVDVWRRRKHNIKKD